MLKYSLSSSSITLEQICGGPKSLDTFHAVRLVLLPSSQASPRRCRRGRRAPPPPAARSDGRRRSARSIGRGLHQPRSSAAPPCRVFIHVFIRSAVPRAQARARAPAVRRGRERERRLHALASSRHGLHRGRSLQAWTVAGEEAGGEERENRER